MNSQGYAKYDEAKNQLEVIRPRENSPRTIRCNNLDPSSLKIHGVNKVWDLVI
jgi:hypothetical protein